VWLAIAGAVVIGGATAAAVRAAQTSDEQAPRELVVQPAPPPTPPPTVPHEPPLDPTPPPTPIAPPPKPHKRATTFEHTKRGAPVETDLGTDR
jgi:hypothetical protein